MTTLFISDLHLSPKETARTELFQHFIETKTAHIDALYILGDLFDYWIGEDLDPKWQQQIFLPLAHLVKNGIEVLIVPGNRDFLLHQKMLESYHIKCLPDPVVIDLYGRQTSLLHGDSLCNNDRLYQWFRRITHATITKKLFLSLPLLLRRIIARVLRRHSQTQYLPQDHPKFATPQSAIINECQKHQVTQLIHGHIHQATIHWFRHNNRWIQRFVLSDWGSQGHVLQINPDGVKTLFYFKGR